MGESAKIPQPPYYAVVFTSQRTEGDRGYGKMAEKMDNLASQQQGFLGIESARDSGLGITVSYWDSLDAIRNWKENSAHQIAQEKGKKNGIKTTLLGSVKWRRHTLLKCNSC